MIASQKKTIHLPQVVLRGTADLGKNGNVFAEATFKLQSPNTRILLSPARIHITDVTISGQVKTNINGAINLGGLLKFTGAGVTVPETGVKISGARGVIPLKWPPGKQMKNGDISIGALYYKQMNFGEIKGKIQQTAAEASRDRYAEALSAAGRGPITTEILPAPAFYYAEDYHQQYLAKNPAGYCGLGGTGIACPVGA